VEEHGGTEQATESNMAHAHLCWINRGVDTHSEYVIPIAFPRRQWLRERASMLRLYVHYLSCFVLTLHR